MKKSFLFIILLGLFFILSGCGSNRKSVRDDQRFDRYKLKIKKRSTRYKSVVPIRHKKKNQKKKTKKYKGPKSFKCVASYYGRKFHGKRTASGEIFNMFDYTAAHKTLPFGTLIKVTNLKNHRSIVVRVNDRGPFVKGRELDLSYASAKALGYARDGIAKVNVRIVRMGK